VCSKIHRWDTQNTELPRCCCHTTRNHRCFHTIVLVLRVTRSIQAGKPCGKFPGRKVHGVTFPFHSKPVTDHRSSAYSFSDVIPPSSSHLWLPQAEPNLEPCEVSPLQSLPSCLTRDALDKILRPSRVRDKARLVP